MQHVLALVHSPFTSAAAWGGLPDSLQQLGHRVVVPEVLDDDEPPFASHYVARTAQQLHESAPTDHLVLIGHSGAGPLLPQLGFARQSAGVPVAGYLFLDAMLPRTLRAKTRMDLLESDDPVFAAELALSLGQGEQFPDWTDRGLAEVLPDAGDRAVLLAGVRPRGLDFFTEELPSPLDWPDAPCSYLALSDPYAPTAHTAELRGWKVERLDAHHFFALTNPIELAQVISDLVADY